ncbi:hypothetical protein COLO4_31785 [Corchorus olitorius]|uniref:Uncharacterized protein n=1 Tax=Corchorus olitorius TaxID=93759 RepID=A0A1R3H385_9ROSI|nr:hypothetical protein COLO4_31785 [Corchorus olitorius]
MAILTSFFSCFSSSNKIVSEGEHGSPPTSTKVEVIAAGEAKVKESKSKKGPPIPMSYFPIGSTFSRL